MCCSSKVSFILHDLEHAFTIFGINLNIPAFLIFIPITTFMARIGAKTVHRIDKNKISKLLGIFLLLIAVKFFYEYYKL